MSVNILKEYIRELILKENKKRAAGFVVVKEFPEGLKILALITEKGYDIPKGIIEPGESEFDAATREMYEESGITDIQLRWGSEPYVNERITAFLAHTDQEPEILPNPETGILEHLGATWVDWDEMLCNCYGYLTPAIQWAKDSIDY